MILLWVVMALALVVIIVLVSAYGHDESGNYSAMIPPQGRATMADVERLVQAGQKINAIRCYREIHNCGLLEAKRAVEAIQSPGTK